jgi:PilZ domain-containing protein
MKPSIRLDERRHFKRVDTTTRDCRLTLIRSRAGKRDLESCILVDLSYAGLRFHGSRPIGEGESLEFLVDIRSPLNRSGFLRGRVRWVRTLGLRECECGVELLESSKGLLAPDED